MSDEITSGEAQQPITAEAEQPKAEPAIDIQSEIKKAVEEANKKWQSRFDTVLGEKKAVEGKALTVEQRLEQIEQERQRERLDWSRKEAKAKAQIDDALDEAIRSYAGTDPDGIASGAQGIREMIDSLVKIKTDEAVKTALEKIGSQPPPKGGQSGVKTMALAEFNKLDGKAQNAFMGGGGTLVE